MAKHTSFTLSQISTHIDIPDSLELTPEDHDWLQDQAQLGGFAGIFITVDITPDPNLRTQIWMT